MVLLGKNTVKPIFHQILFGRVRADNAIHFALGAFQILFPPTNLFDLKEMFIKLANRTSNLPHFH